MEIRFCQTIGIWKLQGHKTLKLFLSRCAQADWAFRMQRKLKVARAVIGLAETNPYWRDTSTWNVFGSPRQVGTCLSGSSR